MAGALAQSAAVAAGEAKNVMRSPKAQFSPLPRLKAFGAGKTDQPKKIDHRFDQMPDPCQVEG
jgi:hypothetical protein